MGWFRKTARDYLLEGTGQAAMEKDYPRAIRTLTKALELDPSLSDGWLHRGIAYLESGQADAALYDFDQAIRLAPQSHLGYYNRALAWLAKHDFERALRDLDEAVRLSPQDAENYNLRAIVHSGLGDQERAIADIERAIELGHPKAWKNKAIFLEKAGREAEALASWTRALEVEPKNALALCRRGLLLQRLGRKEEARQDLEQAWKKRKDLEEHWQVEVEQALQRLKDEAMV